MGAQICIQLPAHLRTIAKVTGAVTVDVDGAVTQRSVLDALEARYPTLRGTIRDHVTQQRRAFVRFFACETDLSHESPDTPLPEPVVSGKEPFLVVGAVAGGSEQIGGSMSKSRMWGSRIIVGLITVLLLADAVGKLLKPQAVVEGTVALGWPESVIIPLGIVLLISTLLYAFPATSILGAILLTGYLGGAVATHVRVGDPLFTHILFPVYLGVFVWGGLWLRDDRLKTLLPLRN